MIELALTIAAFLFLAWIGLYIAVGLFYFASVILALVLIPFIWIGELCMMRK